MEKIPVIAVFDIGKTNKKLLLFSETYDVMQETSLHFDEISDEDGFPCEDLRALTGWMIQNYLELLKSDRYLLKAVNFSAYGASFVYLDKEGQVMLPLYNYLKPYPHSLLEAFYKKWGGEDNLARQTASPALGSLNSGLQVYRLKAENPARFEKIKTALHFPQYLSYALCGVTCTDITSIGCHTQLWNFETGRYHKWVGEEGLESKFAALTPADELAGFSREGIPVGPGLHDSSAALIPYLASFTVPFVLLSTGTWCITLNPFNDQPLTETELKNDCLCYLTYKGRPVKASRLFAGNEHEQQVKRLADHFGKEIQAYKEVKADRRLMDKFRPPFDQLKTAKPDNLRPDSGFSSRNLADFCGYEEAYHRLIADLVAWQVESSWLVIKESPVKQLFVDGGFSRNKIFMEYLAEAFPELEVSGAEVAQASSLGAAMALHRHWNNQPLPGNLVRLQKIG